MLENEPIYVDRVDVSKCKHFKNRTCLADYLVTDMAFDEAKCELCKDCYFKQLAYKTQECEELTKNYIMVIQQRNVAEQQLDQLKAENEKYQLFIEKLCDYAGLECDNEEQAMRTLSDLASQMNKARWIIDRYKQALTKIKEIAEQGVKIHDDIIVSKQIIQIIDEVER